MAATSAGKTNRLATEPSPYLRQHAHNPVDWWPWGEGAFAEARRRDVPVFLSIGYATCHWCHVMAHESFEDPQAAALLNEAFVCVKVDREERPDIDDAYMAACQSMTGSGGWPLTVVLTPDKKPFFAGTYFPRESRHGRIGMVDLVPRIAEAWRTQRATLEHQAEHILQHIRGEAPVQGASPRDGAPKGASDRGEAHGHGDGEAFEPATPAAEVGPDTLAAGQEALARRFDKAHGGFGEAPKFPSPHTLLFLLRQHHRTRDPQALAMVETTLDAMARGGIFDHLGGGFHRYSTDREWLTPHFEKMLYDQALLAFAYAEGFQATRDPAHERVARATLDYVLRELADPAGGFRCAEDADSEGVEGRFYVWTRSEVLDVLGARDGDRFCSAYGVLQDGNFHDEATHRKTGATILRLPRPLSTQELDALAPARAKLLAARSRRVRPLLDDKVLTDWNGLAIAAFAKAATAFGEPRYLDAARRAAGFLHKDMRAPDGRLRHRWHDGRTDDRAFLDDHAYLLWGLLELYDATLEPPWLERALAVARQMDAWFPADGGGFHNTPSDGEDLGARRTDAYDGALPSGNSTAAWCLHRLALLTGDTHWSDLADAAIAANSALLAQHPQAFPMLLMALDLAVGPTRELVVAGDPGSERLVEAARSTFQPRLALLRTDPELGALAPWTRDHRAVDGRAAAYLCQDHACRRPTTDPAELARLLSQ